MMPLTITCHKDHAQLPLLPLTVWQPAGGVQDLKERTDTCSSGLFRLSLIIKACCTGAFGASEHPPD